MTTRGTYPGINRANRRRELDRVTWADSDTHVFTAPLYAFTTDPVDHEQEVEIDFRTVFEVQPLFHWAVELDPESPPLLEGDFPVVNCGIGSWEITGPTAEEPDVTPYYVGAIVWISTRCDTRYRFIYRFGFEGVTYKNISTFRGNNG